MSNQVRIQDRDDQDGTYRPAYRGRGGHGNASGHDGMNIQERKQFKVTVEFINANAWRRKFKAHMAAVRKEIELKDVQFAATVQKPKINFRDWRMALRARDAQRVRMAQQNSFKNSHKQPKTTTVAHVIIPK